MSTDRPPAGSIVTLAAAFVILLVPAGAAAFRALLIILFEVGNRSLALVALLATGLGVLCGIIGLALVFTPKRATSPLLLGAAWLVVMIALAGAYLIPVHGE